MWWLSFEYHTPKNSWFRSLDPIVYDMEKHNQEGQEEEVIS